MLLSGCANDADTRSALLNNFPDEFTFTKYKNGAPGPKIIIKKGNALYDNVLAVVSSPGQKWRSDFLTYAPQYLLRSERMSITIMDNRYVIINFTPDGKKWVQIATKTQRPLVNE